MRALIDTRVFLWWLSADPKLSRRARDFIRDPESDICLSVVSVWEIMLKERAGRSPILGDVSTVVESQLRLNEISTIELSLLHLMKFSRLPMHHRDPFDQLLVAQAQVEGLPIVTGDAQIKRYEVEVIW